MIVEGVFHVYRSRQSNGYKQLDGRLLQDIAIGDDLIILENVNIEFFNRCCKDGCKLVLDDNVMYEKIQIINIFSYGRLWENLSAGMSARIDCICKRKNLAHLLLCKIVKD